MGFCLKSVQFWYSRPNSANSSKSMHCVLFDSEMNHAIIPNWRTKLNENIIWIMRLSNQKHASYASKSPPSLVFPQVQQTTSQISIGAALNYSEIPPKVQNITEIYSPLYYAPGVPITSPWYTALLLTNIFFRCVSFCCTAYTERNGTVRYGSSRVVLCVMLPFRP